MGLTMGETRKGIVEATNAPPTNATNTVARHADIHKESKDIYEFLLHFFQLQTK